MQYSESGKGGYVTHNFARGGHKHMDTGSGRGQRTRELGGGAGDRCYCIQKRQN
jgi:hypothetical protein